MVIYSYVIQHKMRELSETTFRAAALRNATLVESLTALETIKANGAEGLMQAKWEGIRRLPRKNQRQLAFAVFVCDERCRDADPTDQRDDCRSRCILINERWLTMGGLIACTMLSGRALAPWGRLSAC
jgi:ATP-binding cassette subfamily C protein LapB